MPPRLGEYLWYLILGLPLGFGYGFWRHKNVQHKNENLDKARARHAACTETRCCITAGLTERLLPSLLPARRQYFEVWSAQLITEQTSTSSTLMSERLARLVVLALVLRHQSDVAQLNVYPGLKGLKELLGDVPSWVSYEEKERVEVRALSPYGRYAKAHMQHMLGKAYQGQHAKLRLCKASARTSFQRRLLTHCPSVLVQWLNSTLRQMWPYYDAAVCATVKVLAGCDIMPSLPVPARTPLSLALSSCVGPN